jgi:hypothetical protein
MFGYGQTTVCMQANIRLAIGKNSNGACMIPQNNMYGSAKQHERFRETA